ncbi:hypothetical protein A9Z63_01710 [Moraxella lacunata]|uniref:Uncharacterized protein n=1 Tax=Moraxella lacunata TaxID=477 RepID=A0A1B8Q7Y9_MORLA|nr:hypothetical protein A9Z63_01710 [Moraxella lacunata]OBX66409.1 hypothetical protein A9309_01510 [Moraxella lacunata]
MGVIAHFFCVFDLCFKVKKPLYKSANFPLYIKSPIKVGLFTKTYKPCYQSYTADFLATF